MVKVAIVGAAGGIGQPLSLLMKLHPAVTALSLVDVAPVVKGVAADLSHIPTGAKVTSVASTDCREAIAGADLVLIPAGVPRKPGMTRDDLFNINASIVKGVADAAVEVCPKAYFGIISNPVNSTVPIFAEVFRAKGLPTNKILGVTTLDALRAQTFLAEVTGADPAKVVVPVVGGHAGTTIVPLFSQATPKFNALADDVLAKLVDHTQNGGTEVVEAKGGAGSATLSMAQAAVAFSDPVIAAIKGGSATVYAYTAVDAAAFGAPYFATNLKLTAAGATPEPLAKEKLTETERKAVEHCLTELKDAAAKGEAYVKAACAKNE